MLWCNLTSEHFCCTSFFSWIAWMFLLIFSPPMAGVYKKNLVHPHEYSIPSPTNSQWHLGVRSTRTPIFHPIVWSKDSSSWKSLQLPRRCFRLVWDCSTPIWSFFPSVAYWLRLLGSIKPLSQSTWYTPFCFPTQPYFIFGKFSSVIGIFFSSASFCILVVAVTSASASFFTNSSF